MQIKRKIVMAIVATLGVKEVHFVDSMTPIEPSTTSLVQSFSGHDDFIYGKMESTLTLVGYIREAHQLLLE